MAPIAIDGIELDPAIVQAGLDYFALTDANINVIVGDGRYQLNQLDTATISSPLMHTKCPISPGT